MESCIHVIIVDNNSPSKYKIEYAAVTDSFRGRLSLDYLVERKQGRSHACNAGAAVASTEWIAFIDDDEKLSETWLRTALEHIALGHHQYFGGPCLPAWESPPPAWLPAHAHAYRGLLGWIELHDTAIEYDKLRAELCGGNMIVERSMFLAIGGFTGALGRGSNNLMGGEDGELHRRLVRAGAKGIYLPPLSIYHAIPTVRMTIRYHYRWAYWSGVSNRIRINNEPSTAEDVPHLYGIPRYWFRKGVSGLLSFLTQSATGRLHTNPTGVTGLLDFMYLIGLIRGLIEGRKLGVVTHIQSS